MTKARLNATNEENGSIKMKNEIKLFEQSKIRSVYNEEKELWYFSVIDVVAVLTGSANPRRYWSDLKIKLREEGVNNELYEKIVQLKMIAPDGKKRETDAADTETMLRIVQSIPSPKAEPIKQWLARVGYERIKEAVDPEISLERARQNWQQMGHSEKWIQARMAGQNQRGKLTDFWSEHGIQERTEFATLTNIIHREWSGLSVQEHKKLKGLKSQNLRDHMTDAELVFTMLAELTTRQVAEKVNAFGMNQNKNAAIRGGRVAKNAKEQYEKETGQRVVSGESFLKIEKKS